jgi:hypothetical protein
LYETSQDNDDWSRESFVMLQCAGCQTISMGRFTRFDDGSVDAEYYPSPVSRKKPSWLRSFEMAEKDAPKDAPLRELPWLQSFEMAEKDAPLSELINEIYQTVDGGQHRLAVMGIRALLEQVMIAKIGDLKTFKEKLDTFHSKSFVSLLQRDALNNILEVGHAATHRGFKPTDEELSLTLDIMETILGTIYHHARESENLKKRVPPRATKQGKADKT